MSSMRWTQRQTDFSPSDGAKYSIFSQLCAKIRNSTPRRYASFRGRVALRPRLITNSSVPAISYARNWAFGCLAHPPSENGIIPPMLQTTETLIAGLAANDEMRWARFYRDYAPWIESMLLKHTPLSPSDVEDVIHETLIALIALMPAYRHDRAGKGAFHSLVLRIAQNKAYDLLRRETRAQNHRVTFVADPTAGSTDAAEPHITLELSDTDWRRELCAMALRRVLADPTIRSSSKIAFRRYAILGEPAARVAADLGISVNALYQIKNRLTERLTAEVRTLEAEDEAAPQ